MNNIRKCIKCGINKPIDQYFTHQHGDGLSKNCITCTESHDSNTGEWDWDRIYNFFQQKKNTWNKRLWNMLVKVLDEKDDIEQDTLIRLWNNRDKIQKDNNPSGYIFIVYKNIIYNKYIIVDRCVPISRHLSPDFDEQRWLENITPTETMQEEFSTDELEYIKKKLTEKEYKWLIDYFDRKNVDGNKFNKSELGKCNRLKTKALTKKADIKVYYLIDRYDNEEVGPFTSISKIAEFTGRKRETIRKVIQNQRGTVSNIEKTKKYKIIKKIITF